ncbi:hypothetical protein CLOSTHATH_02597 [Hungatella hathewayi DSM 13479]|uniref:Uncharacterized protein n=1 Tax=Hungatella hathewayi DSM 13479 TaxID=566550 RepID=D3AG61_9FIRM|nr:hypothetical protein CLOSTHATH_02597 [Hungatella hathewayi DSM 13479]
MFRRFIFYLSRLLVAFIISIFSNKQLIQYIIEYFLMQAYFLQRPTKH